MIKILSESSQNKLVIPSKYITEYYRNSSSLKEDLITRMEDKIDTYLKPIISDTYYDLEYNYSKRGFLMYIYKGISPKTILDKMLNSKSMSRIFNMNMDRSNPRTIIIKLKQK